MEGRSLVPEEESLRTDSDLGLITLVSVLT